jgi:EAL domain-containing protein (putative c-di-GMP-specific phosphodiesterase class I)
VGITFYPSDALTPEDLLKNADQAMYAAKDDGKNTYHYYTPSMQEAALERRRLISDLRVAIKHEQISVHYQPIFDLRSGRINKAEALVRWQHPERGMIPPMEFIHLAEETGLIIDIGDFVFQEAARFVKSLRTWYDPTFQISVNKSPVQFRKGSTSFDAWLTHLHELALGGDGIVVEITESLLMNNNLSTLRQFERYREAGLQISLDDFGTGYASLFYLKKFSLDYLKIDKSFVRNLDTDPQDKALCEAIIVMAHKLGIQVIAEGVETELHKEMLSSMGCEFAQGYLFSRPVTETDFTERLKQASFPA